ncbi:MAG: acyltransferase [Clostridia bacterium]|nr:acyltransferase [Clostridia bacterium]
MEKSRSKRNGTLEFWRFAFAAFVLLFHAEKYILGEPSMAKGVFFGFFPHGAIGVEFFFLLTGLFLAMSADKQRHRQPDAPIGDETVRFVWKKYTAIFPYHFIAFVTLFIIAVIVRQYDWFHNVLLFVNSLPNLFLFQMTGVPAGNLNHVEWYLSVMIIAIAVIYPLCRRYFEVFTKVAAPVGSLMILGYLGYTCGRLSGVAVWEGHFYRGMIRGFGEILLGTFAYALAKEYLAPLKDKIGAGRRALLTLLEWVCYTIVVFFVIMTFPWQYEFAALFFIFTAVTLSFSGLTYSGRLFDNPVSYFLGKFSLSIYLAQTAAIVLTTHYYTHLDPNGQIVNIVIQTLLFAIVTQLLGDGIVRLTRKKDSSTPPAPPTLPTAAEAVTDAVKAPAEEPSSAE